MATIEARCSVPSHDGPREVYLSVGIDDLEDWNRGAYVQDAFPYLTTDEREILISGTCGKCFDKMFGG